MNPQTYKNNGRFNSPMLWRLATTLAAVLASLSLVLSAFLFTRQQDNTDQIREALIESCVKSISPQRQAVVGILRDQIAQSHAADLQRFFPSIPPAQLHRLIAKANAQRRARIRELEAVPSCEERFSR